MTDATASAAVILAVLLSGLFAAALTGRLLRRQQRREIAGVRADLADVRRRVDELERPRPAPAGTDRPQEPPTSAGGGFLITGLPDDTAGAPRVPPPTVPGPVFADTVLRETAIRTASLAHGVRRALAPQVRNRIGFEMRREVRRSRKQRRAEHRATRRGRAARPAPPETMRTRGASMSDDETRAVRTAAGPAGPPGR